MFPKPHTVEHSTPAGVTENALGQQLATTWVTRQRAVIGWSTKSSTDGATAALDGRVKIEVTLLTDERDWADGDLVTLPGVGAFVVHGGVLDSNTGPFGFKPGYRVHLRRVHDGPA